MNQRVNSSTVKELHKLFYVTLKEQAEAIGIPSSTLSGWFSKDRYFVEYLVAVCNWLRLPLEALLLEEGEEEYVDMRIRDKVMDAASFQPIAYERSRIDSLLKKRCAEGAALEELVKASGIKRTTFFHLKAPAKSGKTRVNCWTEFSYLPPIARALGVELSAFFTGSFSAGSSEGGTSKKGASRKGTPNQPQEEEDTAWRADMERRIARMEQELACNRSLLQQMNEALHQLLAESSSKRIMASEDTELYKPAGQVSSEPDTATSAVKST